MRKLAIYMLVTCTTFGVSLSASRVRRSIFRAEKPSIGISPKEPQPVRMSVPTLVAYDQCDEPLQVVRTKIEIRSIPFSVMRECVKADQAKAKPQLDSKTASDFLNGTGGP